VVFYFFWQFSEENAVFDGHKKPNTEKSGSVLVIV